MRILTVLLTGIVATAWVNARLPWSPFALYFTTLIFMGSYLCLTAGPLEKKARTRLFRRDWALVDAEDVSDEDEVTPWSVSLLCAFLGRMGHDVIDDADAENLGLL